MSTNYLANHNNVVQSYITHLAQTTDLNKTDIALELAADFDRPRSYTLQRLNHWLRGDQPLPKDVYEHMMQEVLKSTEFSKLPKDDQAKALAFPGKKIK